MSAWIKNPFFVPALIASFVLIPTGLVTAQTFTTLYRFTAADNNSYINSDGVHPDGLILSGNTLYGTAAYGGSSGNGTVFAINTDGTGFTNLHSFTATSSGTNSDGAIPYAGLILSGNTLYGTAAYGGSGHYGTVFAVNTNGTGFTNLHNFTGYDGAGSQAGLVLLGNTLYGNTSGVGVFAINTDGTGFTNLHYFTNSDGVAPGSFILSGNTLYGTTYSGGSSGNGTVFKVNTNGTGSTNLYSFTAFSGLLNTNSDGANPQDQLILSGNTLYGTTDFGGSLGNGTVFAVNTDGTGFTNPYSFTGGSDGVHPDGLILSGNTLYGTSLGGGDGGSTVFKVNTDGTGFTNLHNFTELFSSYPFYTNRDGASPRGLILSGNTLYGTASQGGTNGSGTVFSLSLPPPKISSIERNGQNPLLRFSTFAGLQYAVEYSPNLTPGSWTNLPNGNVSGDGNPAQVTDTNFPMSVTRYYRLKQSP